MVLRDFVSKLEVNSETDEFIEKFDPIKHVLVFNTYNPEEANLGTRSYELCAVSNYNGFESCTTFNFEVAVAEGC